MIEEKHDTITCLGEQSSQATFVATSYCYIIGYYIPEPIILYHLMESFLGVPLEAITTSGNNLLHWKGVVGDILISLSARKVSKDTMFYIVYVDLCGYPERWWPGHRFKIAEASGENLEFIELDVRRQLNRLHIKL